MAKLPPVLAAFGATPETAALNVARQFMVPFNAIIARVRSSREFDSLKNPWSAKRESVDFTRYNKTSPADVLFRLMLCLYYFPNATKNAVAAYRPLSEGDGAQIGEPITIGIIITAIAGALAVLGPVIGPLIGNILGDQKKAEVEAKAEQKEKAERKAKAETEKRIMIGLGVVVVGGIVFAVVRSMG